MLVIPRKLHERLLIDDEIEFTIIDILRDKVRVGITAPREVCVARAELGGERRAFGNAAAVRPAELRPFSRVLILRVCWRASDDEYRDH